MERINAVDTETGDVIEYIRLDYGDRVITKKQQEAYNYMVKSKNNSNFVFAIFERCEPYMNKDGFRPQDVTRLIMLSTYTNYNGRLMYTQRTLMDKSIMKEVLREKSNERFNKFYSLLIDLDILIRKNDGLYMSNKYFFKGESGGRTDISRMFIKEIRDLFNTVSVTDLKRLGYIYRLLPFLSKEYNIICKNPEEIILDNIIPIPKHELTDILGIDRTTLFRTLKSISQIRVNGEYLFGWFTIGDGIDIKLIINPKIVYAGKQDGESINLIKSLFKV